MNTERDLLKESGAEALTMTISRKDVAFYSKPACKKCSGQGIIYGKRAKPVSGARKGTYRMVNFEELCSCVAPRLSKAIRSGEFQERKAKERAAEAADAVADAESAENAAELKDLADQKPEVSNPETYGLLNPNPYP